MIIKRCLLPSFMVIMFAFIICKPVSAFVDSNTHWARPQIEHLYSRGFISGYPDDTYRPNKQVSREEFITILIKAIHKENDAVQLLKGDSSFDDVEGRWSQGYIELAHELSISQGDGQGNFLPASPISREEAVTMLVNCLTTDQQDGSPEQFTDDPQIAQWARSSVAYAWSHKLISGYPDGSFRPQVNINRAELACLLEGLLAYQGDQHHFYGTLKSIKLELKQVVVDLNGTEQIFELAPDVKVYTEGSQEPLKDYNLPAEAYFDLDNNGKLVFVLLSKEAVHGQVNIKLSALPAYAASVGNGQMQSYASDNRENGTSSNVLKNDPGSSLRITQDAMKVWDFVEQTGASGRGQLVAVIDSGVDPGHPDLQTTKEKYNKIVDFIDLTNEGKVDLKQMVQQINDYIMIDGQKVIVSGVKSLDGEFHYGYLGCNRLPLDPAVAYPGDKILLVAAKSRYIDRYDTLYIDLDGDGQINDEKELKVFSQLQQKVSIKGSGERIFNFVLAEMGRDGQYVKLGYDAEGHGTMVAGIVAANGNISGVAPDAQILPIKVMNSAGTANLENLKLALGIAAERGVKIAVVSMGQAEISNAEHQALSELAASLWQDYGMAICVAAGNEGPGLSTAAGTSTLNNFISIGAYATPEMLKNDYGWTVKEPELWFFSSTGPSKDGQAAPLLVAPGSAISCYPLWSDYPYKLEEGSSFAAPHVAGAAALLMDAVSHQLYRGDARAVWMALLGGAESLQGYQAAEQGYGAINLMRSWKEIQNLKEDPLYYKTKEFSPEFGYGTGFFSKYLQPGKLSVTISNPNSISSQLALGSLAAWIVPEQMNVQLPANSERNIEISFQELSQPGLYSSFLLADNASTPGWDVAMLQTVVVPYHLADLPDQKIEDQNQLAAGKYKRYFIAVPQGATQLLLSLQVGDKGRANMHIFAPDGSRDYSEYAGLGELITNPDTKISYSNPTPGVWEIIVYSTVSLSDFKLESSTYTFSAALEKTGTERPAAVYKYLVSTLPKPFKAGDKTLLSLHFFNANTKQPIDDVVCIQGRLYEVKNGLLQMEMLAGADSLNLRIDCLP